MPWQGSGEFAYSTRSVQKMRQANRACMQSIACIDGSTSANRKTSWRGSCSTSPGTTRAFLEAELLTLPMSLCLAGPPGCAHWKHLKTTNPVESPFAAVRLRTAAAKRYKKVENATAVIWKTLLIAERTFRRLDAPELLADVASGVVYVNGVRQRAEMKLPAA